MTRFKSVVLTGATGGLGQKLAEQLAAPGVTMLLFGRNKRRLELARDAAVARGAVVHLAQISLQDKDGMQQALLEFDEKSPIDLVIANAGVKAGNVDGVESAGTAERVIEVNLTSTIRLIETVLPGMIRRKSGQIAILSSLAAITPQADLISYSASKAGLRGYATALRRALRGTGIGVSLITPGFVDTPMTDRQDGPTPLKLSADIAVQKILRGLNKRTSMIAFPLLLVALSRLGNLLPTSMSDWFNAKFRAKIVPDEDELPNS